MNAAADLVPDEQVAERVATDLPSCPEVTAAVAEQNKVNVISALAQDDAVAADVASDLLRRPRVAAQVVSDDTVRAAVNRAQVECVEAAAGGVCARVSACPGLRADSSYPGVCRAGRACHVFPVQVGRLVPGLRGREFSTAEQAALSRSVSRVRASADWMETAVSSGNVDLDEALADQLRGE